ncbi:MAG TPA: Lpg1974 family pore-forming outer membrane protein [Novosphingobium sp.]|nr:Lpg1974 family pore-forming outer membrane protein [Novosphingobium sp.]
MKKTALSLLLASALSTPAFAADADQAAPATPAQEAPVTTPRLNVFVEGTYIFNNNANRLPYAQYFGPNVRGQEYTNAYPYTVGSGKGYEISAGVALRVAPHVSLGLAYTGLRTNQSGDTGMFPDFAINTLLAGGRGRGGNPGIATSYNDAHVKTSVAGDVFDFNAGYDVGLGANEVTLIGGFRYAEFHQNTDAWLYDSEGGLVTNAHRRSRFSGVGPELGLKGEHSFGPGVISLEGSVLGSLLFGEQRSFTNGAWVDSEGYDPLDSHLVAHSHVAKTLDAEVGLTFHGSRERNHGAALTVGYKVNYYGGVVDTANGSSGDGKEFYGKTSADLLVHGVFVRLNYKM